MIPTETLEARERAARAPVARRHARLTERYAAAHRKGYDCRVTCARNLLEMHGHRFSYAVLHGLSSTFFFVYRKFDDARCRLLFPEGNFAHHFWPISGQKLEVLENVAALTGSHLVRGGDEHLDAEASIEQIRPYLDEGIPVMVAICREKLLELRGLPIEIRWFPEDMGFGGHWVVVTEIDDSRRVVQLFETDRPEPLEVSFDELHLVRTLGDDNPNFYMKSRNRWSVFEPPQHLPSFASMADIAIRKTVHELHHPLIEGGSGMAAFDAFCAELPDWAERDDLGDKLHFTVAMAFLASEYMVGGGMGRRGYGLFLTNAARALDAPVLKEAARQYGRAGALWQRLMAALSKEVLEKGKPWSLRGEHVTAPLAELHEAETAGFERLAEYVERVEASWK